ncbi:protein-arginine deiminase domain-containing protein [Nocardioides carbamazepini]|uniref:protein-arginine deiminase domain-containing protein n=1 Tax=Nocardioides carbamazepini TaxID=2854259 RepID=UPI002149D1BB|nr:protein-arginine deiminase domain-containing protein [Nocardioides carbamazepini]MCR1785814.1 protein-arginine deiminase domain-containing protein [Nocardioides carbamazepini]
MYTRIPQLRSGMRRAGSVLLAGSVLSAGAVTAVTAAPASGAVDASALILADTDRDGVLSAADAEGRDAWSQDRGALFLANLDDDTSRCPTIAAHGSQLTDVQLASCNDAADRTVNGDTDVKDLARVQVQPVDTDEVGSIRVELRGVGAAKVNVFVKGGDGASAEDWTPLAANGALPAGLIGEGVELGVEGKDIIRDGSWDGTVVLRVVHRRGTTQVATDQVEMRVAPLLFATDRMPIQKLYMADNETSVYEGAELPEPTAGLLRSQHNAEALATDFLAGMERMGADVELERLPSLQGARGGGNGTDIWTQDIMEPGLMSIPSAEGEQQMRVFVRAPVRDGRDNAGGNPFRQTGRVVFTELRGPDVAGIQHFDPAYVPPTIPGMSYDSRGSTGNYGTIPAYEHDGKRYPLGRKVLGAVPGTEYTADPAFNKMLELQGFQDPITLDTSWLSVGHIDEFISVIPADNERGWALVAADPQLAMNLLEELVDAGRGDEQLYAPYGLVPPTGSNPPSMTVAEAVSDARIISGVAIGHAGVNRGLRVLREEVGLTEDDIIRVPVLYRDNGYGRVGVQIPNAANLIGTGHNVVFIPKQHVPAVDGQDLFQAEIETRFAEVGTDIQWAEDYFYTSRSGQIHCVTNTLRDTTYGDSWWSEGEERSEEPGPREFVALSQPAVSGVLEAGRTLTVHQGALTPSPDSVSYQWYRGTTAIPGATSPQLELSAAWAGQTIQVAIVSRKAGYSTLTTVTTIGTVPGSFTQAKQPSVRGVKKVGRTLTARPGSLSPEASKVSYRWYVGNKPIAGATTSRLKLERRWAGKSVKVVITARTPGYTPLKTTLKVGKVRR